MAVRVESAVALVRAALDSTQVLGRGAVEDTYNLLAEGIRLLSRAVAKVEGLEWEAWLAARDTAYGSMEVRESLGEREVIAPTVKAGTHLGITKADFAIDVEGDLVRCPMGQETRTWRWVWMKTSGGEKQRTKRFCFPKEVCRACPRMRECVTGKRRPGRQITLHLQEAQLQAARALEGAGAHRLYRAS